MKKGWKIVFTIFLIVVVIGIVGVGVGMWLNYFAEVAAAVQAA